MIGRSKMSMTFRSFAHRSFWIALSPVALCLLVPDASGSSVAYTYDLNGRVATALYDNGTCMAYTYDAAGNRTAQGAAAAPSPAWGTGLWGCFAWTP